MPDETLSTRIRIAAALVGAIAFVSLAVDTGEALHRIPDRSLPDELWRRARFFTILTNLLAAISFFVAAATGRVRPAFMAALTLWTSLVGIVYHALLARDLSGLRLLTDHGMHTVTPIAVALWWLAFAPKSGLRPLMAAWWLIWPGGYVIYALVRGTLDGTYPYFFVDPVKTGWPMVGVWVAALALLFWLGGLLVIWLARRMDARTATS